MGVVDKSKTSKRDGFSNKSGGGPKKRNSKNKNKKNTERPPENSQPKTAIGFQQNKWGVWKPTDYIAIGTYIVTVRLLAAMFYQISDCDETFNYWEPTHFLLYGKGFQTWEYSPQYALRSYFYLLLHLTPAWINNNIIPLSRSLTFVFIKSGLSVFCSLCEIYFYSAVLKGFGATVAKLTLVFLLFSPGMLNAAPAFLPSSFSMYMCLLATAAWINKKYELAIFATALSTYISWPFAALLGVPLALEMLFLKKQYKKFFQWSLLSTGIILPPLIKMDSDLYGRFVVAPLNIVLYNVFTSHGPDLYGTEPICFYLINGILNFNVAFLAAILAPSVLLLRNLVAAEGKKKGDYFTSWFIISPFFIWFIVFTLQPHKEERFMFPVYPLICLCAAECVHSVQIILSSNTLKTFGKPIRRLATTQFILKAVIVAFCLMSVSRIVAVYKGYRGSVDTWEYLGEYGKQQASGIPVNVCVGKEWYRFPTNFLIHSTSWNVKFLQSDFKGQLPAEYSSFENATAIVHPYFNDMNREEPSRYFDIDKCHFLIDCDYGKTSQLEPNYTAQTDKWFLVKSYPFLNAEKSNPFFRAFYIPFLSERYCSYASYNLLQSTKFQMNPA